MRILFYGDLHVNFQYPDYMQYLEKTLQHLVSAIKEHNPDLIVNLGDTLDGFGTVDVKSLVWAYNWMERISESIPITDWPSHIILRGNHDLSDKELQYAAVDIMRSPRTAIVAVPEVRWGIAFIPYAHDLAAAWELLHSDSSIKVAATHIDWKGYQLPGCISMGGWSPGEVEVEFPGLKVFGGHYHRPAVMGPVRIVGSPLCKNFNDADGSDRGFVLYDTETEVELFIANPNTYHLVVIKSETEEEFDSEIAKIKEPKDTKLKVFVPKVLLDKANSLRDSFLWMGVYQSDSSKEGVDSGCAITLTTSSEDVVNSAVGLAPPEFDHPLLKSMGDIVFNG